MNALSIMWFISWVATFVLLIFYPRLDITVALSVFGLSSAILATRFDSLL
jgi:hypothetical protein